PSRRCHRPPGCGTGPAELERCQSHQRDRGAANRGRHHLSAADCGDRLLWPELCLDDRTDAEPGRLPHPRGRCVRGLRAAHLLVDPRPPNGDRLLSPSQKPPPAPSIQPRSKPIQTPSRTTLQPTAPKHSHSTHHLRPKAPRRSAPLTLRPAAHSSTKEWCLCYFAMRHALDRQD